MANRTSLSTFKQTVFGNRRIVYADLPGGGTTDDFIVAPLQQIDFVSACLRSSVVAGSSVVPAVSFEGTTVNIFCIAATTAAAYTIKIEGR